ncbi:Platinum sensitivity protein [Nowakowskiella sp. JEL0407]|nr:Platinum sensitivity protein [Nowakowskiella sp. JEL0407]
METLQIENSTQQDPPDAELQPAQLNPASDTLSSDSNGDLDELRLSHEIEEALQASDSAGKIRRRVKVYELDTSNEWLDRGTGHVDCVFVEAKDSYCVVVRDETEDSVILNSKIQMDNVYEKQQDTLITWTEPSGLELALSFQVLDGCMELWDVIQEVRNRQQTHHLQESDIDQLPLDFPPTTPPTEDLSMEDNTLPTCSVLPEPQPANLKDIENSVSMMSRTIYGRDQLVSVLKENRYLERLLPVFEICEDLESTEDLFVLSHILQLFICLNEEFIFEMILEDDNFLTVVGIFEYDREYKHAKGRFRDFITKHSNFKQIVPVRDKSIVRKIKQTYRLQFLKDAAMARLLDDPTFTTISSLISINNNEIVSYFQKDEKFLKELFDIVISNEDLEKTRDAVKFVLELCSLTKQLPLSIRTNFYKTMTKHGIFVIFDSTITDSDLSSRTAATSILSCILNHDSSMVRSYCVAQNKNGQTPLISVLMDRFLQEEDSGLRSLLSEILKVLFDTIGLTTEDMFVQRDNENDKFLELVYEKVLRKLAVPLFSIKPPGWSALNGGLSRKLTSDSSNSLGSSTSLVSLSKPKELSFTKSQEEKFHWICELLCFIVEHHSYRGKYFMLSTKSEDDTNIMSYLALLLKSKKTYLKLSALRVFRKCIALKDEFYNRHLMRNNVIQTIFTAFSQTKGKDNLLNSAFFEFFDFIRSENIKSLITHIVVNHRKEMEEITYVSTFEGLIVRYEQNQEPPKIDHDSSENHDNKRRKRNGNDGWSKVDEDEESYFNESNDDDENSTPAVSPKSSLSSSSTIASASASRELLPPPPPPAPVNGNNSTFGSLTTAVMSGMGLLNFMKRKTVDEKPIEFVRATGATTNGAGKNGKLVDYSDDNEDEEDFVATKKRKSSPQLGVKKIISFKIGGKSGGNGDSSNGSGDEREKSTDEMG